MENYTLDHQELAPETLLSKIMLYDNARLRSILSVLYENTLEKYYCILACLHVLKIRNYITLNSTLISALGKVLSIQCPYIIVTKQFNSNCIVVLARLNKLNITYQQCQNVPFANFFIVVNYLHCIPDGLLNTLLRMQVDSSDLYEYIKVHLALRKVEVRTRQVKKSKTNITMQITQGQNIFLQKKYEQWLKEKGFNVSIPLETFLLDCVRNYKKERIHIPSLKSLFANISPDKILSTFGEVYPDITIVAQYPYVK